ncbi:MAG: adenylosuccinate lyase [Wenzhouxiangella sp.]
MLPASLTALSPLDGRYADRLSELRELCSEAGLIRHRIVVELSWFSALSQCAEFPALPALTAQEQRDLRDMVETFGDQQAAEVKQIERTTNHDVKAVEYWLKDQLAKHSSLAERREFIHFACTSEDINNLAWALILRKATLEHLDPLLARLDRALEALSESAAGLAMLSRTHGQPASPTTLGKEIANVLFRLRRQRRGLARVEITGKINGAVGNFNAHQIACPAVDWPALARQMVEDLGLIWNPYTTQIEPHDMVAELCHGLIRINSILLDLARDVWGYVSLGYFRQRTVAGEVGSSTMPHKVNPIDFENAEGNLGLANALLSHLAEKLPISRWQRDLSDSTAQRSLGSALAYSSLAWQSMLKGLDRIEADPQKMAIDLDHCWEVLGEAVQTVMRLHGLPEPYEQLKALTRGRGIDADSLREFIQQLDLPHAARQALLELTPATYTGNAEAMARAISRYV